MGPATRMGPAAGQPAGARKCSNGGCYGVTQGLGDQGLLQGGNQLLANPLVPADVLTEGVGGSGAVTGGEPAAGQPAGVGRSGAATGGGPAAGQPAGAGGHSNGGGAGQHPAGGALCDVPEAVHRVPQAAHADHAGAHRQRPIGPS
eukprot:1195276-Prorocentrum_minimum.AAC.9